MTAQAEKLISLQKLDKISPEDLYHIVLKNKRRLNQWFPWPEADYRLEHAKLYIEKATLSEKQNKAYHRAIFHRNKLSGVISLRECSPQNRSASIAYWIAQESEGKGIAKQAAKEIINLAFNKWNLNRLEIYCATENRRSCHLAKSLGFQKEGLLRQKEWLHDHFVDHFLYSLLKKEWIKI